MKSNYDPNHEFRSINCSKRYDIKRMNWSLNDVVNTHLKFLAKGNIVADHCFWKIEYVSDSGKFTRIAFCKRGTGEVKFHGIVQKEGKYYRVTTIY